MNTGERVNIGPQAKDFRAQGVEVSVLPAYSQILPESPEALEYYARMKPELYALFSVVINRVVEKAYFKRNVPALVDRLDSRNPFLDLDGKLKAILTAESMDLEQDIVDGIEGEPTASAKRRLEDLLGARKFLFPNKNQALGITPSIEGGIHTATSTMSSILDTVNTLGNKKTKDEKLTILANTYPFIMRMSSMHISDFLPYISVLQIQAGKSLGYLPLNPYLFEIKGEGEDQRLDLSEAGLRRLDYANSDFVKLYGDISPTVGCPANVNFGEGSAIRRLWDWNMEIADQVWQK